jgi:hypothetical protein
MPNGKPTTYPMSPATKIAIDSIKDNISDMKKSMTPTNGELGIMITNLCTTVETGFTNIREEQKIAFKGTHDRQDTANHGIKKNREGIEEYKKDKIFIDELKMDKLEKKREIRTLKKQLSDYTIRALVFGCSSSGSWICWWQRKRFINFYKIV